LKKVLIFSDVKGDVVHVLIITVDRIQTQYTVKGVL